MSLSVFLVFFLFGFCLAVYLTLSPATRGPDPLSSPRPHLGLRTDFRVSPNLFGFCLAFYPNLSPAIRGPKSIHSPEIPLLRAFLPTPLPPEAWIYFTVALAASLSGPCPEKSLLRRTVSLDGVGIVPSLLRLFFVSSELGSPEVPLLRAFLQIISMLILLAEFHCSLSFQHEDTGNILENPYARTENVEFAQGICGQQWCNKKGDITCEICQNFYQYGYAALSPLAIIVWPSCSAISARYVHRVIGWVLRIHWSRAENFSLILRNLKQRHLKFTVVSGTKLQLASPFWADELISFKERVFDSLSSLWERSTSLPSFDTKRIFSPSPYSSSNEETFGVQPQILPLSVDLILTEFKIRFLPNSTEIESTLQSDSITSVMPNLSDVSHVDFYEILLVFRNLKKCLIYFVVFAVIFILVGYYALTEESSDSYLSRLYSEV